jgi:acyl-CoA thioesterase-2
MTSENLLLNSLALEPIERNLYRGRSETGWGGPRIFGGQVIAQALLAAYETVKDRHCHSLHAYFERPGNPNIPILYEVERSRDGSSFTTRRVAAVQNGEQIFNLAASFHIAENGLQHQSQMPDAPAPETLPDEVFGPPPGADEQTKRQIELVRRLRTIELRQVHPQDFQNPRKMPPAKAVWGRSRDPIGSDLRLQHAALGFASDMNLFETAMRPHGMFWSTPGLQSASLDHALWFHQPFDFAEWHLFVQESTIAHSARGFVRGSIFSRDGRLVASVAQEGLLRYRAPKG